MWHIEKMADALQLRNQIYEQIFEHLCGLDATPSSGSQIRVYETVGICGIQSKMRNSLMRLLLHFIQQNARR